MQTLYEAGDSNVKPDVFTFTSLISALLQADVTLAAPKKQCDYLKYMNDAHAAGSQGL